MFSTHGMSLLFTQEPTPSLFTSMHACGRPHMSEGKAHELVPQVLSPKTPSHMRPNSSPYRGLVAFFNRMLETVFSDPVSVYADGQLYATLLLPSLLATASNMAGMIPVPLAQQRALGNMG